MFLNTGTHENSANPFYSSIVLDAILSHKIPLWPLWSSALVRFVYNNDFLRESNAAAESSFNVRKNCMRMRNYTNMADFVRDNYDNYEACLADAQQSILKAPLKPRNTRKAKNTTEEAQESWRKKGTPKRESRHLSQRDLHLSPQPARSISKEDVEDTKLSNMGIYLVNMRYILQYESIS